MAYLIFHDGKRRLVGHNQATKVLAILEGKEEPEDKAQADFVMLVKEVQLPQLPTAARKRRSRVGQGEERAKKIEAINRDSKLSAREKFKLIGQIFKEEN